jgi:hypothetical protein
MKARRIPRDDLGADMATALSRHSIYSAPETAALWHSMGGHDVYWIVEDSNEACAVLTGVEFGRGPIARFQAMPDGLPGGVYYPDGARPGDRTVDESLFKAIRNHGYAKVFFTDFGCAHTPPDNYGSVDCKTDMLDLDAEDWAPADKKLRSEIRKAEREGVTAEPFVADRDFEPFIRLMESTERRHGRAPKYSSDFYKALAALCERDDRIWWRVVNHEGRMAASHIYVLDGTIALYWQAFLDKEMSYLKANQYMLYSTAQAMRERGVLALNLGQSPPEADGLSAFKGKWGAQPYCYPMYTSQSLLGRLA